MQKKKKNKKKSKKKDKKKKSKKKIDPNSTVIRMKGLPWSATEDDVNTFFAPIIPSAIHIIFNQMGRASGQGYVEFSSKGDGRNAMKKDKTNLGGRYIVLFTSTVKELSLMLAGLNSDVQDISDSKVNPNSTVIRMTGLPFTTTEDKVNAFFAPIKPSAIHIFPDDMGRASGQGYVEFWSPRDGQQAMTKQKRDLGGRYIELCTSTPKELSFILARLNPDVQDNSYLVKMRGLPYTASRDQVLEFFEHPAELLKVHFIYDRNGNPSGEAFAEFSSEGAQKVALRKSRKHLGSRYIELFKSTPNDLKIATFTLLTTRARVAGWIKRKQRKRDDGVSKKRKVKQ